MAELIDPGKPLHNSFVTETVFIDLNMVPLVWCVWKINGDEFSEKLAELVDINNSEVTRFFQHNQEIVDVEDDADDEFSDDELGGGVATNHESVKFYCINQKQASYQRIYQNDVNINAKLDLSLPISFLIHGWMGSFRKSQWMNETSRDWVNHGKTTVCACDWAHLANANYMQAAKHHIYKIGQEIAAFIVFLTSVGIRKDDIIVAGHSLGAHIAGLVGKNLQKHKLRLKTIFGLDPAGPFFTHPRKIAAERRLCESDAKFVQVLHTSMSLGTSVKIGHSDFWANGGTSQPGCSANVGCSHSRAHQIFRASLNPLYKFHGTACKATGLFSYFKLKPNSCSGGDNADQIGIHSRQLKGNFDLHLKETAYPYVKL